MVWIFSKNEYNECNQKIGVKYAIYGKWVCDQNDPFINFLKGNKMMIWISNKAVNKRSSLYNAMPGAVTKKVLKLLVSYFTTAAAC